MQAWLRLMKVGAVFRPPCYELCKEFQESRGNEEHATSDQTLTVIGMCCGVGMICSSRCSVNVCCSICGQERGPRKGFSQEVTRSKWRRGASPFFSSTKLDGTRRVQCTEGSMSLSDSVSVWCSVSFLRMEAVAAGAPGEATEKRDPNQSGDSVGSVERTSLHPSSRAMRASLLCP